MEFKAAKCPNCNGDLQVPDDKDVVKCMYCGNDIFVREAIKLVIGVDVSNLIYLANAALEAGNSEEAYSYFTKILESNGKNADAWFGKGVAAGYMSTLAKSRIDEMISNIEKSIEYSDIDNKIKFREMAANSITTICSAYYETATNHYNEFSELENSFTEYVYRCLELINSLEKAYEIKKNKITLDWILYICNTKIFGNIFADAKKKYAAELNNTSNF